MNPLLYIADAALVFFSGRALWHQARQRRRAGMQADPDRIRELEEELGIGQDPVPPPVPGRLTGFHLHLDALHRQYQQDPRQELLDEIEFSTRMYEEALRRAHDDQ